MEALALARRGIIGRCVPLGDKEIAVGIRSNSHYRISALWGGQVGMLIGLFGAKALGKGLLGNEGADAANCEPKSSLPKTVFGLELSFCAFICVPASCGGRFYFVLFVKK